MNKIKQIANNLLFKFIKRRKDQIAIKLLAEPFELYHTHPIYDFVITLPNSYIRTKWFFEFYKENKIYHKSLLLFLAKYCHLEIFDENKNLENLIIEALENKNTSLREAAIKCLDCYFDSFGKKLLEEHKEKESSKWIKEFIDNILIYRSVIQKRKELE